MNKEEAKRRILELTLSEEWQENQEVVAEVQRLGKLLHAKEPRGRKKSKKIAVWYKGKILVSGTAKELAKIMDMKEQAIRNRLRNPYIDSKGRQFKYLEETK